MEDLLLRGTQGASDYLFDIGFLTQVLQVLLLGEIVELLLTEVLETKLPHIYVLQLAPVWNIQTAKVLAWINEDLHH